MNLRSIDLNLLVILEALLDEAHVSRAAERLGLSQPATSAALDRCRYLFNDVLLERGKAGMRRTPKAESLRDPVKTLLAGIKTLIDAPAVPLAELRQVIRLTMADTPAAILIAPLLSQLRRNAPGLDLILQPWNGAETALEAIQKGTCDLAVSVFPTVDPAIERVLLLEETYCIALRQGHPAADNFDLERWLAFPHILVSGRGDTRTPLDQVLADRGLRRRVGLVLPSFLMVPPVLASSDLVAMLPRRCIQPESNFVTFDPPIPVPGFPLHLAWHQRAGNDPAIRYVASEIRTLLPL